MLRVHELENDFVSGRVCCLDRHVARCGVEREVLERGRARADHVELAGVKYFAAAADAAVKLGKLELAAVREVDVRLPDVIDEADAVGVVALGVVFIVGKPGVVPR